MRIFNQYKSQELFNVDLTLGKLIPDQIITHHEAIEGSEGKFHYETIHEYPNGGKDLKQIWDVEPTEAKEAWNEIENIQVYVPYTSIELAEMASQTEKETIISQIQSLKEQLASWDYKTSKYVDGEYSEQEWQEIVVQRKMWRKEINQLENNLRNP